MSRAANRKTPVVISDCLYSDDEYTGTRIDSQQWIVWLATGQTFFYDGQEGTFTARAEQKQRGGLYFVAYRKTDGKLRKVYLGKPDDITGEKLKAAASHLKNPIVP